MIRIKNIHTQPISLGFIGTNGVTLIPNQELNITEADFDNPSLAALVPSKISVVNYGTETYEYLRKIEGAEALPYDNTESGLTAETVQAAVDELVEDGLPAESLPFDNDETTLVSTTVQGALEELNSSSNIVYDNTESGLVAETVQDGIDEIVSDSTNIVYDNTDTEIAATNVGDALTELDSDMIESSYVYKAVCGCAAIIKGLSEADLGTLFWTKVRKVTFTSTIEDCINYFWIKVITADTDQVIPATKYATTATLTAAIYAIVDKLDGVVNENINLYFMEKESTKEPFTQVKVCRNSLFSGLIGSHKGKRLRQGLSTKFEEDKYYVGPIQGDNIAISLMESFHIITPATNDNRIIWNTNRRSNAYGLPKVGTTIKVSATSPRYAYNTDTSVYEEVSDVPFTIGAPKYLVSTTFGTALSIETLIGSKDYMHFLNDSVVAVFPLSVADHRAFAIYPVGFDVFVTDYVNAATHDAVCIIRFKSERKCKYVPPTRIRNDGISRTMWRLPSIFNPARLSTCSLDGSLIPAKYEFAIINKTTGIISKKQNVATIKRRLPNAPLMIAPSFNTR